MKYFLILIACLFLVSCNKPQSDSQKVSVGVIQPTGPFDGIDLSSLPANERKIITEASEDFVAVLSGHSPVHAKYDESVDVPASGGTAFYVGNGYKLTVKKSISSFGQLHGMAYGPVLEFDKSFMSREQYISNVRFYTNEQLKALLSSSQQ